MSNNPLPPAAAPKAKAAAQAAPKAPQMEVIEGDLPPTYTKTDDSPVQGPVIKRDPEIVATTQTVGPNTVDLEVVRA